MNYSKITKITLLMVTASLFQEYVCSQNNMPNKSLIIPLEIGKNKPVQFENLVIEPVNLFVQSRPLTDRSPTIQLELNLTENDQHYSTYLWYYETKAFQNFPFALGQNFPKALGQYLFKLEFSQSEVQLVVEKLSFDKAFFIDIGQQVIIGNLAVLFEEHMSGNNIDENFNYIGSYSIYTILLSENNETKAFDFPPLSECEENKLLLEWKDYQIRVLSDDNNILELMVVQAARP